MSRNKTWAEAFAEGKKYLAEKENGSWDALQLLLAVMGCDRISFMIHDTEEMTKEAAEQYAAFLNERKQGKPLQYILGECGFMGLSFSVGEGVLIPRSDTEILVETILEKKKEENLCCGLDIGTGTGCIPISLEKHGGLAMTAVDVSQKALSFAKENQIRNESHVDFLESDLFAALQKEKRFDFIVSNPPYIPKKDIAGLMTEVRDFEPQNALDGGEDGLDFYRAILNTGRSYLREGGWIFFEIGYHQKEDLFSLMEAYGFCKVECRQDLAGLDRVVFGKKE